MALRYFNVFGPRQDETSQYAAVLPKFIAAIMSGTPTIYGDRLQSRDFTYIDNMVHSNLLALEAPEAADEVMNLAVGGSVSLLTPVEKLKQILYTNFEPIHAEPRSGDMKYSRADVDEALDLLDFAPVTSFDEGLARTVEWFSQQRK